MYWVVIGEELFFGWNFGNYVVEKCIELFFGF